jgi:hypothetical protein
VLELIIAVFMIARFSAEPFIYELLSTVHTCGYLETANSRAWTLV